MFVIISGLNRKVNLCKALFFRAWVLKRLFLYLYFLKWGCFDGCKVSFEWVSLVKVSQLCTVSWAASCSFSFRFWIEVIPYGIKKLFDEFHFLLKINQIKPWVLTLLWTLNILSSLKNTFKAARNTIFVVLTYDIWDCSDKHILDYRLKMKFKKDYQRKVAVRQLWKHFYESTWDAFGNNNCKN